MNKEKTIVNYDKIKDQYGAIVPPIYQNSLFAFDEWDKIDDAFDHKYDRFLYSRLLNPTALVAEEKIAKLAGGEMAKLCASGIAAITSCIMHCISANTHIITVSNIYGPTNNFINKYLKDKFNVTSSFVDGKDVSQIEEAIRPNTKLIFLESPASLTLELQDLSAVSKLAKKHGIKTVIDNTWATPIFQKPIELGIDLEVHSVSKYIGGHSDLVAGVVIGSEADVKDILAHEHEWLGAKIAPFEAWLILRSLRTLPIRMQAHQESAMRVCEFLSSHDNIEKVYYPGHPSFPQFDLAQKQMRGSSGLLSFELATQNIDKIKAFVNHLKMFKLGVSWGGHDSLVYAPVISYLKELPADKFEAFGLKPNLIRISVGLEDAEDLIKDLEQALQVF